MTPARRARWTEALVTTPSLAWLLVFFVVPTVIIFAITFKPVDLYGGIGKGWTLDTLKSLFNPNYPAIVWRTVWLSLATTAVCLILAVPCGYYVARSSDRWRQMLLLLIILPFWTSFLVRVFAWKVLLHPEGPLKHALAAVGLIGPDTLLLYNEKAILLVMVYTFLPFAILPIYAAAEKFDFRLLEAARDLGARPLRAFWSVFVPGIRRGLLTAVLVVFIPALGSYVIPDIVGGPNSEMIGNKIAQRTFSDRNLPHASGLSAFLTLGVLLPLLLVLALQRKKGEEAPSMQEVS
ncbi:MAG TPA: ABC transporter permease [Kiritimatiellia bacterium]|nr:ABC transporter permease [Kiritimatiellia bacterium]HRZ12831.1 ABC transporter permease [Kiritimatiellia bacterium]HSA18217.1 ABC transporter permease [Kiritimatiellia bacterium]